MQKVNNEGQLRWLGPEKGVIGGKICYHFWPHIHNLLFIISYS